MHVTFFNLCYVFILTHKNIFPFLFKYGYIWQNNFFQFGIMRPKFPQARSVHEIQNIFLLKIFSSQTLCFFLKNFDSYLILNVERIPYSVIIFGD